MTGNQASPKVSSPVQNREGMLVAPDKINEAHKAEELSLLDDKNLGADIS